MGQVTVYLDDESERQMRRAAKAAGVSVSRWLAELVHDRTRREWPEAVIKAAGTWTDFPDIDRLRADAGKDTPREPL